MSIKLFGLGSLFMALVILSANAQDRLEPAFRVINVNGENSISLPGQNDFVAVEESKAYPYGSHIRTGSRSSLVLVVSEGNVVRVLANADLVFNENTSNPRIKNIRLNDGEVEIELMKNFHESGNVLNVETATAVCGAVGTHFRVASRMEQDLRIVIFRVIEGVIRVFGENFEIVTLKANDWVSLLSPSDKSFLRLKNMKGNFDVKIKDENMNDKNVPTVEGTVLKIWQRQVPETNQRIITAVLTNPAGEMIETVTVTYGPDMIPQFSNETGADIPWTETGYGDDNPPPVKDNGKEQIRDNPVRPEEFFDELVDRTINEENVEYNRHRRSTPPPRQPAPRPPSPTPVGKR